jgi:hypothetical protein
LLAEGTGQEEKACAPVNFFAYKGIWILICTYIQRNFSSTETKKKKCDPISPDLREKRFPNRQIFFKWVAGGSQEYERIIIFVLFCIWFMARFG